MNDSLHSMVNDYVDTYIEGYSFLRYFRNPQGGNPPLSSLSSKAVAENHCVAIFNGYWFYIVFGNSSKNKVAFLQPCFEIAP